MADCKHKFKPRYDEIYSTPLVDMGDSISSGASIPCWMAESYLLKKIYVHDVCVKCGTVAKRGQ